MPIKPKTNTVRYETWPKAQDPFYRTKRWVERSRGFRREHPVCMVCNRWKSEVTDHIVPLKDGGEPWADSNLQALCHRCHNRKTARERVRKGPKTYSYANT